MNLASFASGSPRREVSYPGLVRPNRNPRPVRPNRNARPVRPNPNREKERRQMWTEAILLDFSCLLRGQCADVLDRFGLPKKNAAPGNASKHILLNDTKKTNHSIILNQKMWPSVSLASTGDQLPSHPPRSKKPAKAAPDWDRIYAACLGLCFRRHGQPEMISNQ